MVLDQISNMQAIFHAQIDFRSVKRKQSQYHGAGVIMTIALHFFLVVIPCTFSVEIENGEIVHDHEANMLAGREERGKV